LTPIPESAEAAAPPGATAPASAATALAPYTVVARRYRPQRFEEVVGQDQVVQSLRNAIRLNRIAQAYLFCGTRGVGKTSMARIFAKCLNCVKGPTEEPCQTCDICQSIALGQDVDVIEIDGASNNGVEQVRELRQNAPLRPSRARFKIYYVDEVHMLSIAAFNALLKTLEEPPAHVKFIFATTEASKIPITVLSRCQRYDFAGITPEVIASSLGEICAREGIEAEPEALQAVARRASGSLRDAQSLLDRLLASGSPRLSVELVHSLLGTASDERLLGILEAMARHDPAQALLLVDDAAATGVQPAEMLSGLIDFLRDALMLAVGADSMLLAASAKQRPRLKSIVADWPVDSILAALQILAECRARMRGSLHGRFLLELAVARVARLENLAELSALVERLDALESGAPAWKPASGGGRRQAGHAETGNAPNAPRELPASRAAVPPAAALAKAPEPAPAPAPAKRPPVTEKPACTVPSPPSTQPAPERAPTLEAEADRSGTAGYAVRPIATAPRSGPPEGGTPTHAASGPPAGGTPTHLGPPAGGTPTQVAQAPSPESDQAAESAAAAAGDDVPVDLDTVRNLWPDLVKKVGGLGWRLSQVEPVSVVGSDVLVIAAKPGYNAVADACGTPDALLKIGQSLQRLMHRPVNVKYENSPAAENVAPDARQGDPRRADSFASDPLVQKVLELFEARPLQMEYDDEPTSSP
jgi:DNA polymerase-3 subunit gamma/tau